MRRTFVLSAALVSMAVASASSAHDTMAKNWCGMDMNTPVVLETFEFDGSKLRKLAIKCGIVDSALAPKDDWDIATETIAEHCRRMTPDGYTPQPFVFEPQSYGASTHHEDYRLDDGLSGACAICMTR